MSYRWLKSLKQRFKIQAVEDEAMIIIRFEDRETKKRALGFLAGRFSFKSWASGEMAVPESALAPLASEGIAYTFEEPSSHERLCSS